MSCDSLSEALHSQMNKIGIPNKALKHHLLLNTSCWIWKYVFPEPQIGGLTDKYEPIMCTRGVSTALASIHECTEAGLHMYEWIAWIRYMCRHRAWPFPCVLPSCIHTQIDPLTPLKCFIPTTQMILMNYVYGFLGACTNAWAFTNVRKYGLTSTTTESVCEVMCEGMAE